MISRCALVAVVTVTASMFAREQIVEVTYEDRIGGIGRCPPASRIVSQIATSLLSLCWCTCAAYSAACTCQIPGPQR
jgi:hypothetical protein